MSHLALVSLRRESTVNSLGLDATTPWLSWTLESERRGEMQRTYRVRAATYPNLLASDQGD